MIKAALSTNQAYRNPAGGSDEFRPTESSRFCRSHKLLGDGGAEHWGMLVVTQSWKDVTVTYPQRQPEHIFGRSTRFRVLMKDINTDCLLSHEDGVYFYFASAPRPPLFHMPYTRTICRYLAIYPHLALKYAMVRNSE